MHHRTLAVNVPPNTTGLPGLPEITHIVGALLTGGLVISVAGLVIAAIVWAIGHHLSNPMALNRGKTGVLIALAASALTGGADALVNFFAAAGGHL
jgi:hypothetical protein